MLKEHIIYLLITYKYSIIVPLAFLEGHFISLLVGFLARNGQLNIFIAGMCVMAGNLLGDIVLYWLGYFKGEKFLKKWSRYVGISDEKITKTRSLYSVHKSKILLLSKVTNGFGLSMAILFTAGIVRIGFLEYLFWNIIGESIWTGSLISIGYFLGDVYLTVDSIFFKMGIVVLFLLIVISLFYYLRKILKTKMSI
jgi:membrane-associated protein